MRQMTTTSNDDPALSSTGEHERTVVETGELHRLLVERVLDYAIFALDPRGYILTWNSGAERLKGYRPEEAIGKHFSIFYPQADLAAGKPARELEVATELGRVEDEGWRLRKDGTRFWANVLITALRDDNGELLGFAKVTRDLSERRAAQEQTLEDARRLAAEKAHREAAEESAKELRRLSDQLQSQAIELERRSGEAERANRVKTEFLAAMSHELRTPLNAIGGYAELMAIGLSGPVTREQLEQLHRIQRSQQHLLGIINDLLNYSRIEGGHVRYDIVEVVISDVIEAVVAMIGPEARSKQLQLTAGPCSRSLTALGAQSKIEQVLLNLLSNAVKFTPAGGTIEVTCGDESRVWLRVRDNGIGISAGQHEAIFAPFVQVGRTLANPQEGTGLGLSISRDLARAMGGDLTVESREGAGSAFTLWLPRSAPQPAATCAT
jgi:PAS domain S-box-containing protein